jgi:hypothetical protein
MYKIEELKKLKSLYDQGAISENEFTLLKKQIISNQKESISSENSTNQNDLLRTKRNNVLKKVSYINSEETTIKKKQTNVWQEGNYATGIFLKTGLLFSVLAGLTIWYRYNFFAFIIFTGISITGIVLLGKVKKVLTRNLYLGLISVGLLLLNIFPLNNNSNSSSSGSDSNSTISSGSSYSSETRTCSYCGKEFSGNGYYHLFDDCVEGDKNLGSGNMCSRKCCNEEWLTDPNNRHR